MHISEWFRRHVAYLTTHKRQHEGAKAWYLYIHIFPVYCVRLEPWRISWHLGVGWSSDWVRRRRTQQLSKELRKTQ
jgi:hypothetical protein